MDIARFGGVAQRAAAMLIFALPILIAGSSNATTIDLNFNQLSHGQVANGSIGSVTISATDPNGNFRYAVGFDSFQFNTRDPDLQSEPGDLPWSGGNIREQHLGTMLILQENDWNCLTGTCSHPDDEGSRPAGTLRFDFSMPVISFGFDAIDIESISMENALIDFFDGDQKVTVHLSDFFDNPTSLLYDPTLELGDNTANRFNPITVEYLGLSQIDRVDFKLGGSGALDNITATLGPQVVPEPTTALLLGLGLAGLAAQRRTVSRVQG